MLFHVPLTRRLSICRFRGVEGCLHLIDVIHRLNELVRHGRVLSHLLPLVPTRTSIPVDLVFRESCKESLIEWMIVR